MGRVPHRTIECASEIADSTDHIGVALVSEQRGGLLMAVSTPYTHVRLAPGEVRASCVSSKGSTSVTPDYAARMI
jgi:hypothetical protein